MNQRKALLDVLASGGPYTMDELISRVGNRTGGSVKASSLTVHMSRLRNEEGFRVVSRQVKGVWQYRLRGKNNRDRAKREASL